MRPVRLTSSVRAWLIAARLSESRRTSRRKGMVIWRTAARRPMPIRTLSPRVFWKPCAAPASRPKEVALNHLGNMTPDRSERNDLNNKRQRDDEITGDYMGGRDHEFWGHRLADHFIGAGAFDDARPGLLLRRVGP